MNILRGEMGRRGIDYIIVRLSSVRAKFRNLSETLQKPQPLLLLFSSPLHVFISMSSQSPPQGVCLLIKYHGARASQLSATAPFNETSSMPFREDLRTMRFPLPKIANIRLVSDTTIVAWWPDVSRRTVCRACYFGVAIHLIVFSIMYCTTIS